MSKSKQEIALPGNGQGHSRREIEVATPRQLVDSGMLQLAQALDGTARAYSAAIQEAPGHMERAILMANGITAIRKAITPEIMTVVMSLMNSPNGFRTDRDGLRKNKAGQVLPLYNQDVVKECLITSLLLGFYPVNNEWNIISYACYPAQNGWKRKVREFPGISDIRIQVGEPAISGKIAKVRVALSWKVNGVANCLLNHDGKPGQVFSLSFGGFEGIDQLAGKATTRAWKAAYEILIGSECTLGDTDTPEFDPTTPAATEQPAENQADRIRRELEQRRKSAPASNPLDTINVLIRELGMGEAEVYSVCESLEIPGNLQTATLAQQEAFLQWLRDEKERAAAEAAEELADRQRED